MRQPDFIVAENDNELMRVDFYFMTTTDPNNKFFF